MPAVGAWGGEALQRPDPACPPVPISGSRRNHLSIPIPSGRNAPPSYSLLPASSSRLPAPSSRLKFVKPPLPRYRSVLPDSTRLPRQSNAKKLAYFPPSTCYSENRGIESTFRLPYRFPKRQKAAIRRPFSLPRDPGSQISDRQPPAAATRCGLFPEVPWFPNAPSSCATARNAAAPPSATRNFAATTPLNPPPPALHPRRLCCGLTSPPVHRSSPRTSALPSTSPVIGPAVRPSMTSSSPLQSTVGSLATSSLAPCGHAWRTSPSARRKVEGESKGGFTPS